jgi:hypothetical protein
LSKISTQLSHQTKEAIDVGEAGTVAGTGGREPQVWSMDFMHDQLRNGHSYWLFNVIASYNYGGLGIRSGFFVTG